MGWVVIGKPFYISSDNQDVSFTSIIAFSDYHLYGIMFKESLINSSIII